MLEQRLEQGLEQKFAHLQSTVITTVSASLATTPIPSTQLQSPDSTLVTKKHASARVTKVHFRLPSWLYNRSVELELHRTAARSWSVRLNPRRLVPLKNAFFDACYRGNLALVRNLLEEKKGSVYDVDSLGHNALHVRLEYEVRLSLANYISCCAKGPDLGINRETT